VLSAADSQIVVQEIAAAGVTRKYLHTKTEAHTYAPKDLRYIALYIDFLPGCKILEFNFQVNYRPSKMKRVHGAYAQYIVDQFTKETLAHLNYNRLEAFI